MLAALIEQGIHCAGVPVIGGTATGVAHILVDERGENQIVVARGANAHVAAPAAVVARILLAQLETPVAATAALFAARRAGHVLVDADPLRRDALCHGVAMVARGPVHL